MEEINSYEEFRKRCIPTQSDSLFIKFSNCKFNFEWKTREEIISIQFKDCVFTEEVLISSLARKDKGGSVMFHNVTFKKKADFTDSHFEVKARFTNVQFLDEAIFNNTKFDDLADFWGSVFHKPTIFHKTDFMGVAVFSTTRFKENVLFTYTLIDKIIILRGTIFEKGLDLSLTVLNDNFNVFDIRLRDYESVHEKSDEEYLKYVSESAIIPEKNKRETFRLLKKQMQSQGNMIDSLTYSALETKTYFSELEYKICKERKYKGTVQNYMILGLNFLSNNNGKSWLRAVLFTLGFGAMFFYFSIISTANYKFGFFTNIDCNDWELFIKGYFTFLLPTHDTTFLSGFKPSSITYLLDYFGRILVTYGIYQTVQAFRKFKSN